MADNTHENVAARITPPPLDRSISMYHLDVELAQLIEYRNERLRDTDDPPTATELDVLDQEIARYMVALPKKVANVTALLRAWRAQREAAQAEVNRYRGIVAAIAENEQRVKDCCAVVLERQPAPAKGSRKLTGTDGSVLMLKGNGGVAPLLVDGYDEEHGRFEPSSPLPNGLRQVTVRMTMELYLQLDRDFDMGTYAPIIRSEPDNGTIRTLLASDCELCGGMGQVVAKETPFEVCPACDGTRKRKVPGARLGNRGSHIEVR